MANSNPKLNWENRKAMDMPTRERMLALVQILQSYDASKPLAQSKIPEILKLYYFKYVIAECVNAFKHYECEDLDEAKAASQLLLSIYTDRINEDVMQDEDESAEELIEESIIQEYPELIDCNEQELIEILLDFAECNGVDDKYYLTKIAPTLHSIKEYIDLSVKDHTRANSKHFISQATVTQDLRVLERFGFLKRINKRRVYGLSAHKTLDLWQLKIIYELVNNQRFLQDKERQEILDTILYVTSKTKHDQAMQICHPLDSNLYSRSPDFKNNLEKLLSIMLKAIEKEKRNPKDRSSVTVRFKYRHSRVDRNDKTPDSPSSVTVYPIDIVSKDSHFYLLGAGRQGIRSYRIDRMIDPEYIDMDFGYAATNPEWKEEKEEFYRNNTNNFTGGRSVEVTVRWDFEISKYYTALFDIFDYENISQGREHDQFIIKTRDNYGLYLNLLRLGPVIEVVKPQNIRDKYCSMVKTMAEKHQS